MLLCRIALVVFGILYGLALAIFLVGTFGLLGQEVDPLSAVFLVILGQPWIGLADQLPEGGRPIGVVIAPLLTLLLLWLVCRFTSRRTG